MAKSVELYTTDFALEAQGASYKGLIIVNKVSTYVPKLYIPSTLNTDCGTYNWLYVQ